MAYLIKPDGSKTPVFPCKIIWAVLIGVVVVATIAEGVEVGNVGGAGYSIAAAILDGQGFSPRIVGILRHFVAIAIHNLGDIALTVVNIIICCAAF